MRLLITVAMVTILGQSAARADLLTTAEVDDALTQTALCKSSGFPLFNGQLANAECFAPFNGPFGDGSASANAHYGFVDTLETGAGIGSGKGFASATDSITIQGLGTGYIAFDVTALIGPAIPSLGLQGTPGPMTSSFSVGQSSTSFPFVWNDTSSLEFVQVLETVKTPFTFGSPLIFSLSTGASSLSTGLGPNSGDVIQSQATIGQISVFSDPSYSQIVTGLSYASGSGTFYSVVGGKKVSEVVPEPGTLMLAGLGGLVIARLLTRRMKITTMVGQTSNVHNGCS